MPRPNTLSYYQQLDRDALVDLAHNGLTSDNIDYEALAHALASRMIGEEKYAARRFSNLQEQFKR